MKRFTLLPTVCTTQRACLPEVILAALIVSAAMAQVKPGFEPNDVVRQVRAHHLAPRPPDPLNPGLDDGEFLIDTSITYVPAPEYQEDAAVAFGGGVYLVVWTGDPLQIRGARVTESGGVLDPVGFSISSAGPRADYAPAVAFDGTNFLVVWSSEHGDTDDIHGARVSPSGNVLDSVEIVVSDAPDYQVYPAVAFDGTNYLVVWEDCRTAGGIYGARVSRNGEVLDSAGIAISIATSGLNAPAIAFGGADFLVVWADFRNDTSLDIYGARVSRDGTVLDPEGIAFSAAAADQDLPVTAFDGTNFLVAWEDYRRSDTADVFGTRVDQGGNVLDPDGIAISIAADRQGVPVVAFDSANCLVVWEDRRDGHDYNVYGARVTPGGVVLDPEGIVVSAADDYQFSPAIASGGATCLAAWNDYRCYNEDIYGARLRYDGTVIDPFGIGISKGADEQQLPAVTFGSSGFLVVWQDQAESLHPWFQICGARVSPSGVPLDARDIAIASAERDQCGPRAAFDGSEFLVVWGDLRNGNWDVYGTRVGLDGSVLDPNGIVISAAASHQCAATIASDGTNYLVVWEDSRNGDDIYGARVSPSGVVLDPDGLAISTAAGGQGLPAVVFGGTNYLVVWEDRRSGSYPDIRGARISPSGVVLDSAGIAISTAADEQRFPAVAFDGTNSLVVWQDWRNGHDYSMIYGARVSPAGAALDSSGIPISVTSNASAPPAVAFDGTSFLAAWMDERAGDGNIWGARVRPDGSVFDSGPIVRQEGYQISPALARGPGNLLFLVYQGWTGTVGGRPYNSDRVWGKLDPRPGIAEAPSHALRVQNPMPSHVWGVLEMPLAAFRDGRPGQSTTGQSLVFLLDIAGRKVLDLHPGPNDVSGLAAGVYFMRGQGAGNGVQGEVRKVVIQR